MSTMHYASEQPASQYCSGQFSNKAFRPYRQQRSQQLQLKTLLAQQELNSLLLKSNNLPSTDQSSMTNFNLKPKQTRPGESSRIQQSSRSVPDINPQDFLKQVKKWVDKPIPATDFINFSSLRDTKTHLQQHKRPRLGTYRLQANRCISSYNSVGSIYQQSQQSFIKILRKTTASSTPPRLEIIEKQPIPSKTKQPKPSIAIDNSFVGEIQQQRLDGKPDVPVISFEPIVLTDILNRLHYINESIQQMMLDSERYIQSYRTHLQAQISNVNSQFKIISMQEQSELCDALEMGNIHQLDPILRKLKFFDRFDQEIRYKLYSLLAYERYQQGQIIFEQGDRGDKLYIILKGSVEVIQRHNGAELIVSSLYDGQYFGELSLMETKKTKDQAERIENVKIKSLEHVIHRHHMRQETICFEGCTPHGINNNDTSAKRQFKAMKQRTGCSDHTERWKKKKTQSLELVLQLQQRRTATIRAAEDFHCLVLSRHNFQEILLNVMQEQLDERINILKETTILRDFHSFALIPLANQLKLETFTLDQLLVKEGQVPDRLFLVVNGTCYTSRTITAARDQQLSNHFKTAQHLRNFITHNPPFPYQPKPKQKPQIVCPPPGENKLQDYLPLKRYPDSTLQYVKVIRYQTYQRGQFLFGRVLYSDESSKVNLVPNKIHIKVSESNELQVYTLSREQLEYLPEFMVSHLVTEFGIGRQVDDGIDPVVEDKANLEWDQRKSTLILKQIFQSSQERGKDVFKQF